MGSYYKLVTMKVLIILGVLYRLVYSRYIVVDNAGQMTSQPMQMTSQPVHMTSQPVHMTSPPVHMTSPPVHMTSQPMHIPTIGGMRPISTSAYQPGFFGGTGSAVFQGSGGVVVEGSGTAMFAGQGATAFGGEGSAHFQFDDNTVFVQSVEGGGFVGIA